MDDGPIALEPVRPDELARFKAELQDAFALAIVEAFGALPAGPLPSNSDLDHSIEAPGAEVLHILRDRRRVGGAVVNINHETGRNSLELLFLVPAQHGRGLGQRAWTAIEQRYPGTRCWQTHTPYFEKRNIHFYVNKCGFRIVEFFNAHHPDPHHPGPSDLPGGGEMFRFEKTM